MKLVEGIWVFTVCDETGNPLTRETFEVIAPVPGR
jgi:hypothetical protein